MEETVFEITTDQYRNLDFHRSTLRDMHLSAEAYERDYLDSEFFSQHINAGDVNKLRKIYKTIRTQRLIVNMPVHAFLCACPNPDSSMWNELWLMKARAWFLYENFNKKTGFDRLLIRALDSVRLILIRDEVEQLSEFLLPLRFFEDELQLISTFDNRKNLDEQYLRRIQPYRLLLQYALLDLEENPRKFYRRNASKRIIEKPQKTSGVLVGSSSKGGDGRGQGQGRKSKRHKRGEGSKFRQQHLEKKSKHLTSSIGVPGDRAVQRLVDTLVQTPSIEYRAAYTALAYSLVYGASVTKLLSSISSENPALIPLVSQKSAIIRCGLKAEPDPEISHIFEQSDQRGGIEINSEFLEYLDNMWSLTEFQFGDVAQLGVKINSVVRGVRNQGFWITKTGIAKYRSAWMAHRAVDSAEMTILNGEINPDSAGTHYHRVSVNDLQHTHNQFEKYVAGHATQLKPAIHGKDSYAGSSVVLTQKTILEIFRWLQARIDSTRYVDPEGHHNAITVFTEKLLCFSCGYRAVNHPWWRFSNLDFRTGMLHVSDKDRSAYSISGRIVILPDRCLGYIQRYVEYVRNGIFSSFSNQSLSAYKALIFSDRSPVLFYSFDGKPVPVRPVLSQNVMDPLSNLPPNWPRHYMRGRLRKFGVSGDLVDLWMGHDNSGSNPMHVYSGLSMSDLRTVANALNRILIEDLDLPSVEAIYRGIR